MIEKVRIALFHTTLPEPGRKLGGVEVAVHRLANALVGGGDHVTVYSLSACPSGALYRHRCLFGGRAWLRKNPIGRLLIVPILLNIVSFGDADVVHLHGDDWFFLARRKPTVRTLHGSALREAQTAPTLRRKWTQYAIYPLERLSAVLCTRCVGLGSDAARIYKTTRIVDLGIDSAVFFPGPKSPEPTILYVGTWRGRKRGEFIYRTFTETVLPRVPTAKLCMVSDECPSHPAVISERFPSDETLARRYRESWVFAYPSIYEGFGIAYLEALASATAIISSPNDGARHILDNGKYGVIAGDSAFGGELVNLLTSHDRRERFEKAGLDRARQFSWDRIAAQHRQIYRSI